MEAAIPNPSHSRLSRAQSGSLEELERGYYRARIFRELRFAGSIEPRRSFSLPAAAPFVRLGSKLLALTGRCDRPGLATSGHSVRGLTRVRPRSGEPLRCDGVAGSTPQPCHRGRVPVRRKVREPPVRPPWTDGPP